MRRVLQAQARRLCVASSDGGAAVDAAASGLLSVRQRLKQEPVDQNVLELIEDQQLGQPPRSRRRGSRHGTSSKPPADAPNALERMGFIGAAHNTRDMPPLPLAEIAFAGRSNVGKSSLLNALTGKGCGARGTIGIASVANKPGVTRSINFYSNPYGAQLVDLPGYGFAFAQEEEVVRWQDAMRAYLGSRGDPLRVLLVVDARQSLKQSDKDFLLWLDREVRAPLHVVMSKCDLVHRVELAKRYTLMGSALRSLHLAHIMQPHHMVSSRTGAGIDLLRASMATLLPSKLMQRASKRVAANSPSSKPSAAEASPAGKEVVTPAARRFADAVTARKAQAQGQAQDSGESRQPLNRQEQQAVAHGFWAQRQKAKQRSAGGAARGRRR